MSYLAPSEFVTKMVDAGESKVFTSTRDTIIRAYMAGAILALAAWCNMVPPPLMHIATIRRDPALPYYAPGV